MKEYPSKGLIILVILTIVVLLIWEGLIFKNMNYGNIITHKKIQDSLIQIIDKEHYTIDSIKSENFSKEINLKRYEIAIEMFKNEDSLCQSKLECILKNKTE